MVFLNRTTFSAAGSVDFDFFSTSYFNYMVIIESISAATATDDIWLRMRYGTTTEEGAIYYSATQRLDFNGTASTLLSNAANQSRLIPDSDATYGGAKATIYFNQVGNSSQKASWRGVWETGDSASSGFLGGNIANDNTYTGFRLRSASSTITGQVSVYGLAKA
jgi:hypothetical protein